MNTNWNTTAPDVDRILSTYFKAEMPDPFPQFEMTGSRARVEMPMPASRNALAQVSGVRMRRLESKSRLSLAVSVALLFGGCWYLSGQIGKAPEQANIGKGENTARIPKELQKSLDDVKKAPDMP